MKDNTTTKNLPSPPQMKDVRLVDRLVEIVETSVRKAFEDAFKEYRRKQHKLYEPTDEPNFLFKKK